MAFKGITAFILNNGEGGGGGEPTGNYNDLTNHPQVNGNELIGNKTAEQLGLLSADTDIPTKLSDLDEDTTHRTVTDSEKQSWNNKVDSVAGKGLSTNDYTDEDQEDVAKIDGLVGTVGSLSSSVGIVSGKVRTLEEEMLSVEDTLDTKANKSDLGTASTKNSTSVVTESTDLVESGAVFDTIKGSVGFVTTGKNKLNKEDIYSKHSNLSVTQLATGINITANSGATWASVVYKLNIEPNTDYIVSSDVDLTDGIVFFQLKHGTTTVKTGTTITENGKLTLDFNLAYNDEVYLHIFVSNATAYLTNADLNNFQLEKGSTATAYEPYHASVDESKVGWDEAEGYVGYNLFDYDAVSSTATNITFTVNQNKTISISGSANTSATVKELATLTGAQLKAMGKSLILSGGATKAYLALRTANWTYIARSYSDDVPFSTDGLDDNTTYYVTIGIQANDNPNNSVIKPMIRPSGTPSAYMPYLTPNTEIPNKCDNSVIGTVEDGTNPTKSYAVGEHFIRNGKFCTVTSPVTTSSDWTLNTNYIEEDISAIISRLLTISPESQFSGNCNDLPAGFSYVTNSATNAPEAWSIILTYSTSIRANTGAYLTQIAYPANGNDYFYKRTKINGVWQSWVKHSAIKSNTFSGTTNASGNLSITTDLTRVVLGIELDNDQTALKYKTSNYIGIHIMNASTLEAYANQSISGTYYYI